MSILASLFHSLADRPLLDFSEGEREDHWRGLRLAAILQVCLTASETEEEFVKAFQRIGGTTWGMDREHARTWLNNFLMSYVTAGEFTPKLRALAQRFLKHAPKRYRLNPEFYEQFLRDYKASPRDNQAKLVRLSETYDLDIVWRDPLAGLEHGGRYSLAEPGPIHFAFFVPVLVSQLSLYPVSLTARAGLKRVILCRDLRFCGRSWRGMAVYAWNAICLDMSGGHLKESCCTLVHHEFFHLVDKFALALPDEDEELARLNAPSSAYGLAGQRSGDSLALTADFPGFMTAYAATNTREDKAELFGHMVVNYGAVERRASADRVLAAKVELMKRRLEAVCPEMDAAFWETRREADFWTACKPALSRGRVAR